MKDPSFKQALIILGGAVVLLALSSMLPWSAMTGNRVKSFSLISDIVPMRQDAAAPNSNTEIDPELLALAEGEAEDEAGAEGVAEIPLSADDAITSDTVVVEDIPAAEAASMASDGSVMIENYTGGAAFEKFRAALAQVGERVVRVAVLGDSFIEGDIMTQDLRRLLQERYGGQGVGYVSMYSAIAGFRMSIRQKGDDWKVYNTVNNAGKDTIRNLSSEYAVSGEHAYAEFRAAGGRPWTHTRAAFIVRDSSEVTMQTRDRSETYTLPPSDLPQVVSIDGETDFLKVSDVTEGLISLGVYLDGENGIAVDCISNRGSSGLNLRRLNASNCVVAGYDLIIVEYGINALNVQETDYTAYGIGMKKVLNRLKTLFPQADVLMLGIADRGEKINGEVHSLPMCRAMVSAQRNAARQAGVHFYDVRASQGGEDAVVEWRRRGLVNADYIHLNSKGGAELARELAEALVQSMENASAD